MPEESDMTIPTNDKHPGPRDDRELYQTVGRIEAGVNALLGQQTATEKRVRSLEQKWARLLGAAAAISLGVSAVIGLVLQGVFT